MRNVIQLLFLRELTVQRTTALFWYKPTKTRTQWAQDVHGSGPIKIQDVEYPQLTGNTSLSMAGRYACCGCNRESIILDMESDALLNIFIMAFGRVSESAPTQPQDEFESTKSEIVLDLDFDLNNPLPALERVVEFVAKKFTMKSDLESKIAAAVLERPLYKNKIAPVSAASTLASTSSTSVCELNPVNAIFLEDLVHLGLGQCRHQVLLAGYLLVKLIHHFYPDAQPQVYRFRTVLFEKQTLSDEVSSSNEAASASKASAKKIPSSVIHAVIIYKANNNHLYLLDPSRRLHGRHGLVFDLTKKMTARTRKILHENYAPYEVNLFLEEIFQRYRNKPQVQSVNSEIGPCSPRI